jgi:non-ribosomal peptide synthase protein (TIGR01720 family)
LLDFTGFVVLEREATDNPGDALRSIRDQFRRIPNRGLGLDMLHRLSKDAASIKKVTPPLIDDLMLSYLGNVDRARDEVGPVRPAQEPTGNAQIPQEYRDGLLYCHAFISDGQFAILWHYSKSIYKRATIEAMANDFMEALRALIAHCQSQSERLAASHPTEARSVILPPTEQGLVTGPLPLTSAQRWFLEAERPEPNRFNNNALYIVRTRLDFVGVEQAVQHLLIHHDALRSRFVRDESGWHAFITEPDGTAPVIYVDLSTLPETMHEATINQVGDDLQGSLDLFEGPLLRVGLYDLGDDRPGRLHITMHHMTIDAHSITVLLEDLQTACLQLIRGEQIRLLPKTTSVKQWLERLITYTQSAEMRQELDYWLSLPWSEVHHLPVDFPEGRQHNIIASNRSVKVRLSSAETDMLLRRILPVYDAQVLDVLLMGMVQATSRWTGRDWVTISLTDSGRGAIPGADVDLSRTIGWLAHAGFILLKREETDNPGDALCSIRDQFRRIPNRGLGFDLLVRYSEDDIAEKLSSLHQDDLKLNYLGNRTERSGDVTRPWQPTDEPCGNWQRPQNERADLLYCPAFIAGDQLVVQWEYSENIYKRATIEALANDFIEALRALIAHCQSQPDSL